MSTPRTLYARSGGVDLAYQVVGDGPRDIVLALDWASHPGPGSRSRIAESTS